MPKTTTVPPPAANTTRNLTAHGGNYTDIDGNVPGVWNADDGRHAHRRLPILLGMPRLRHHAASRAGRLLRFLLLW